MIQPMNPVVLMVINSTVETISDTRKAVKEPMMKPPMVMIMAFGSYSRKLKRGIRHTATEAYAMAQSMATMVIFLVLLLMMMFLLKMKKLAPERLRLSFRC